MNICDSLQFGNNGCVEIDMEWLSENIICGTTPPGVGNDGLNNNDGCISVNLCDSLEFGNNGCVQIDMEWLAENIICDVDSGLEVGQGDECIQIDMEWLADNIICDVDSGLEVGGTKECIQIDMEWLAENIICDVDSGLEVGQGDECIKIDMEWLAPKIICDGKGLEVGDDDCIQIDMEWLADNIICGNNSGLEVGTGKECIQLDMEWLASNIICGPNSGIEVGQLGDCIQLDMNWLAQNIICDDKGLEVGDTGECIQIDMEWLAENIICKDEGLEVGDSDECIRIDMEWLAPNIICHDKGLEVGDDDCIQIDMEWLSSNIICNNGGIIADPIDHCVKIDIGWVADNIVCIDGGIVSNPSDDCIEIDIGWVADNIVCDFGGIISDPDPNKDCIKIDMDWLAPNIICTDKGLEVGTGGECIQIDMEWLATNIICGPDSGLEVGSGKDCIQIKEDWLDDYICDFLQNNADQCIDFPDPPSLPNNCIKPYPHDKGYGGIRIYNNNTNSSSETDCGEIFNNDVIVNTSLTKIYAGNAIEFVLDGNTVGHHRIKDSLHGELTINAVIPTIPTIHCIKPGTFDPDANGDPNSNRMGGIRIRNNDNAPVTDCGTLDSKDVYIETRLTVLKPGNNVSFDIKYDDGSEKLGVSEFRVKDEDYGKLFINAVHDGSGDFSCDKVKDCLDNTFNSKIKPGNYIKIQQPGSTDIVGPSNNGLSISDGPVKIFVQDPGKIVGKGQIKVTPTNNDILAGDVELEIVPTDCDEYNSLVAGRITLRAAGSGKDPALVFNAGKATNTDLQRIVALATNPSDERFKITFNPEFDPQSPERCGGIANKDTNQDLFVLQGGRLKKDPSDPDGGIPSYDMDDHGFQSRP